MRRGRTRGSARGRGNSDHTHKSRNQVMSRKESMHLRQFGEKHPSEEDMQNFHHPKKFKSNSRDFAHDTLNSGGGRGRGKEKERENVTVESSDSESEDEPTPYTELLTLFSGQGKKKEARIDSGSDDEMSERENEDKAKSESDHYASSQDSLKSDSEIEEDEVENIMKQILPQTSSKNRKGSEQNIPDEELTEADLPDESVIQEAELDPELNDENSKSIVDPFILHFEREMSGRLQSLVQDNKFYSFKKEYEWPRIGRFHYYGITKENDSEPSKNINTSNLTKMVDLSAVKHSRTVEIPDPPSNPIMRWTGSTNLESLFIKSQLHRTIPIANKTCVELGGSSGPLTALQDEILTLTSQYYDLYFPYRTFENADEIRLAYCIHGANHILKTRTRIIHHNAKMAEKVEVPDEFRDQGFVRPKILMLTPFKESGLKIVNVLISLLLTGDGTVQNKKRFINEYGGETLFMPKTNPKPDDYMATFTGNVDDNFKIGLSLTKKCLKLYTGFYSSDIIIASPLGLRLIIGAEGEKGREFDFLSSIEILIVDQADVFLMQNWDHILHLMRHLNLQPLTTHGTNFARIRPWALDGLTKHYCQSLVFSSIICPEHNALFSRYFKNYAGLIKIVNPVVNGSISQITVQLPQVFQQFQCAKFQEASDARFKYFVDRVLPNFSAKLMSHTLIFVSSYFDFVRLRNFFKREKTGFVQICEYTKDKKVARARDYFFHGQTHFLLYTERAHFFRRFRLKGIGHVIFYQLPHYSHFYSEICNLLQEEYQIRRVRQRKNSSVNVIYCKYDASRLAPIVGTTRANYMLTSDKTVHAFVSSEGDV